MYNAIPTFVKFRLKYPHTKIDYIISFVHRSRSDVARRAALLLATAREEEEALLRSFRAKRRRKAAPADSEEKRRSVRMQWIDGKEICSMIN